MGWGGKRGEAAAGAQVLPRTIPATSWVLSPCFPPACARLLAICRHKPHRWARNSNFEFRDGNLRYRKTGLMNPHQKLTKILMTEPQVASPWPPPWPPNHLHPLCANTWLTSPRSLLRSSFPNGDALPTSISHKPIFSPKYPTLKIAAPGTASPRGAAARSLVRLPARVGWVCDAAPAGTVYIFQRVHF